MSETNIQAWETCITAERFYLGEWSLSLIPFPTEQVEETLQSYINKSPSLRVRNDTGNIDTSWQDILTLKCSDGVCTCIVSQEWNLVNYNFVSSSITSLDFKSIKFPGKENIPNFLSEHLTSAYKYREEIQLIFSDGVFVVQIGISSCEKEASSPSSVITSTQEAVASTIN